MKNQATLVGDTVKISAVRDHQIGYGEYQLTNVGTEAFQAEIVAADLRIAEKSQNLQPLYLLLEDSVESVPATSFEVPAQTTSKFTISFPGIEANAYFGQKVAIHLKIKIDDALLEADSPIVLERRIPRR